MHSLSRGDRRPWSCIRSVRQISLMMTKGKCRRVMFVAHVIADVSHAHATTGNWTRQFRFAICCLSATIVITVRYHCISLVLTQLVVLSQMSTQPLCWRRTQRTLDWPLHCLAFVPLAVTGYLVPLNFSVSKNTRAHERRQTLDECASTNFSKKKVCLQKYGLVTPNFWPRMVVTNAITYGQYRTSTSDRDPLTQLIYLLFGHYGYITVTL